MHFFRTLLKLSGTLWEAGIPLIVCRSYGMVGYMRLVVKDIDRDVLFQDVIEAEWYALGGWYSTDRV